MGQTNLLLREARENAGLLQPEIAAKLGVGMKTYSSWECGDHVPYLRHRRELAKIFKMSLEKVNALFRDGTFPSSNGDTPSDTIELNDTSEYREEQKEYLQGQLGSRLLSIVDAGTFADQRKAFAQIVEQFDAMNTENPNYQMTRRQAVISLATFPFVPPINLEKRDRVSPSYYELFLQECGASLAACEELLWGSDPNDLSLAFRCVCRYLVELEEICNSSLRYRQQALELAAHCAILKARLGWDCVGNATTLLFVKDAMSLSRESGDVCLQLSAHTKQAWAYLWGGERELALETANDARNLLETADKERRLPICIRGGTYSTLAIMQARNGLDPDRAIKKASEQGADNEIQFLLAFAEVNMWREQGDALCYFGATDSAMGTYIQIINPETLEGAKPSQGTLTEDLRLGVIEGMVRASLGGNARNMDNAVRYWKEAIEGAKRMKSESKYRRALALHDDMKLAFPGETGIFNLRDHFRRGKGKKS